MSDSDSGIADDFDNKILLSYQSHVVVCRGCRHVLFTTNEAVVRQADYTSYNINVSKNIYR